MFAAFKDFDKDVADLFSDDFDNKYTLKVKAAGPEGTTVSTNLELVDKEGKQSLKPKLTLKYPHPSGFTLDKLEVSNDCRLSVETSLDRLGVPGLKLDFKGNDAEKADVGFKYIMPAATFTGEVDVNSLNRAEGAISTGHGPFAGGVSAVYAGVGDAKKVTLGLGVSHVVPNVCYTAVRANNNFSNFSLLFSYAAVKNLTVAGQVDHSTKKTLATGLVGYKVDPVTVVKVKGNSEGIINASVKRSFDKRLTVAASVEVPHTLKTAKWGVNATLG
jgi:hypothetical protein